MGSWDCILSNYLWRSKDHTLRCTNLSWKCLWSKKSVFSPTSCCQVCVMKYEGADLKVTDRSVNTILREDAPLGTSFQRDGTKADPLTDYTASARSGREEMGVWLTDHLALSTSNGPTHHWPQTRGPKSIGRNLGKLTEVQGSKISTANLLPNRSNC